MQNTAKFNVLILAGQRSGTLDPLACRAGVSHKCLIPVLGQSLIGRVATTVAAALPDAKIFVSIEDAAVLDGEPTLERLKNASRLRVLKSSFNLVDSVRAASEATGFPLLITTADNVLVTPEALATVAAAGLRSAADVQLVMARKESIQAAHPGGKSRYYEFRDGGYSNCNLFWLANPSALTAAEMFREGGQFLKVAGRMLRAVGPLLAFLYRVRVLTIGQAFARLSRRLKVGIEPLVLGDGRLAIDVDDQRSKEMVEELLCASAGS